MIFFDAIRYKVGMNPYAGLPLTTLTEGLTLAQTALMALGRGEAVAAIATGDKRISFMPTDTAVLEKHIAWMRAAIFALQYPAHARRRYAVARFPEC